MCRNENEDFENCCSGTTCDLDTIKSLAWEPSFGLKDSCYHHCDAHMCYNTRKTIPNKLRYYRDCKNID